MSQLEILQEKPLTMVELQEILKKVKSRDKELNPKSTKLQEYINKFNKFSLKEKTELESKIRQLEISRLSDKHITKIIDLNPEEIDSLKIILSSDNLTLKQEDLKKVIECFK